MSFLPTLALFLSAGMAALFFFCLGFWCGMRTVEWDEEGE